MKLRLILPVLSLAVAVTAAGCGGGSSSSGGGGTGKSVASFAGTYVGAYNETGSGADTGEVGLTVSSTGVVTGRVVDVTSDGTVSLSGQVTYVSSTATTVTGTFAVSGGTDGGSSGNLTLDVSTGTLSGSLINKTAGATTNFANGLISTKGQNSFAGFYTGTYTVNGAAGTPANTVSLIVDVNGKTTGIEVDNIAGQTGNGGTATGSISNSGAMTIGTTTGKISLTNGIFTGTLNDIDGTTQVVTLTEGK